MVRWREPSGWSTFPLTQSGFMRVASNHRATADARTPGEEALLLHMGCQQPGHRFVEDSISLAHDVDIIAKSIVGSSLVTDLHVTLIARSSGSWLVTFDKGAAQVAADVGGPCELLTI